MAVRWTTSSAKATTERNVWQCSVVTSKVKMKKLEWIAKVYV